MSAPGVFYSQRDISQVVQGIDSAILGIAGSAKWGPSDKLTQVSGLKQYVQLFGKPVNPTITPLFYQLYMWNKLAKTAWVVRAQGGSLFGGVESAKTVSVAAIAAGLESLPKDSVGPSGTKVVGIYTKYAGVHDEGDIYVNITEVDVTAGTFNIQVGFLNSEGAIDTSSDWYEQHSVSVIRGAKDPNNRSMYIKDVLDRDSQLLYGVAKIDALVDDIPAVTSAPVKVDKNAYTAATEGEVVTAYTMFNSISAVTIDIVIPSIFTTTGINAAADVATARGDSFYIATPDVDDLDGATASVMVGVAGWLSTITRQWFGSGYAMYYNIKDEYNDTTVAVPAAGLIAAAYAYSDGQSAQWFAPAGPKRGIQPGVELGVNWSEDDKTILYDGGLNWVASTPRYGITLEGQKTLYGVNSALNRVNVARLMLKMKRDLMTFLQDFLYEFNNNKNRTLIFNGIDNYLRDIKSREGLIDYRLVCDDSNNTPSIIDQNKLIVDIYVKPAKVAEFLYLRSTIASTGVDFSKIISQA